MVNIYTFCFNEPEFLRFQYLTFKKFLKDEHKLICINNAVEGGVRENIKTTAKDMGIDHYIPQNVDHSMYGLSHQSALNWTWKNLISQNNDINIIVDHDMFAINEFSCTNLEKDIYGIEQSRGYVKYFHPGFMILNNTLTEKDKIDFYGGEIEGHNCDTGGQWHYYLQNHPDLKIVWLPLNDIKSIHNNLDYIPKEAQKGYDERYNFQIVMDFIFHFRIGSNWIHLKGNDLKRRKEQLYQTLNFHLNK